MAFNAMYTADDGAIQICHARQFSFKKGQMVETVNIPKFDLWKAMKEIYPLFDLTLNNRKSFIL